MIRRHLIRSLQPALILVVLAPLLMGASSGCPNVYSEMATKTSDAAYLHQARLEMDARRYSAAIETIESMTPTGREQREVRVLLASAYAGRCGLELIDLASGVADGTEAGLTLYPILLAAFSDATSSHVDDCIEAEEILVGISEDASARTADENILLAFVEFAKLGSILGASGVDVGDDGTVDVGFDACADDADNIEDFQVRHMGTALTIAMASIAASGTSVVDEVTGTFASLCSTIEAQPGLGGFCSQTDISDFDALEIKGLRALIKSDEIGFDTCGGAFMSSLACSCL